jgi:hypothetical protein
MLSDDPAAVTTADALHRRLPGPAERLRCSPDSDQNPNSFRSAIRLACTDDRVTDLSRCSDLLEVVILMVATLPPSM